MKRKDRKNDEGRKEGKKETATIKEGKKEGRKEGSGGGSGDSWWWAVPLSFAGGRRSRRCPTWSSCVLLSSLIRRGRKEGKEGAKGEQ